MKIARIYFILLTVLIISSCDFFNKDEKKEDDNYPKYNAKVAWESDVKSTSKFYGVQEDKFLYLYDDSEGSFKVVKLDCKTGKTVWRSPEYIPMPKNFSPVIIGDKLFLMTVSKKIYSLDKNSGKILAVVQINNNPIFEDYLVVDNDYLYFGLEDYTDSELNKNINCLARLNINYNNINYAGSSEIQIKTPEKVWYSKEYNNRVIYSPLIKDDVIYFFSRRALFAVGLEDFEPKWEKPVVDNEGDGFLLMNNDIIYMMRGSIGAYNIYDGKSIYLHPLRDYSPFMSVGIAFYNNRIFYTNANSNIKGAFTAPYIVCLDANNGNLIWGRLDYDCFSLGVVPVLKNNKMYLPKDDGLNVIDANTGELLGLDKKFYSRGAFIMIYQYDNLMIFANSKDEKNYRYIAIDISE